MTLFVVRHGETEWNREGRFQGQTDIPLSEVGRAQAMRLAHRLADAWQGDTTLPVPVAPLRIYTSDLQRARQTAAAIEDACSFLAPRMTQSLLLRERSFGGWEGLTTAEIRARYGAGSEPPADAEPTTKVWERMLQAYQKIWEETLSQKTTSQSAMIVGHGGSLRMLLARTLGMHPESARHFHLDNTALSVLRFQGASPETAEGRIWLANDTAHLSPRFDVSLPPQ